MKKRIKLSSVLTAVGLLFTCSLWAQVPERINYQAVARNAQGNALQNTTINVLYEIRQGSSNGPAVYSETHTTSTNQFGLFTIEIGSGNVINGNFSSINWGSSSYFLFVEVNGNPSGASQLLSVPYALYSKESLNGSAGTNSIASSTVEPAGPNCVNGGHRIDQGQDDNNDQVLQSGEIDFSYYICNGLNGTTNTNDTSITNELQTISISNDTLFLSNGGFAILPPSPNSWSTSGNTGTTPASNFLGTIDAQELAFRTNNIEALRIKTSGSVGIGTNITYGNSKLTLLNGGLVTWGTRGSLIDVSGGNHGHSEDVALTIDGKPGFDLLQLRNNTTSTLVTVNQFGYLGLGTNNPDQNLDVVGGIQYIDGNQTAGSVLTSDANGNASWQGDISFSVEPSSSLSITTPFPVTFNITHFDFGSGVSGNQYIVQETGRYMINFKFLMSANAVGDLEIRLLLNGNAVAIGRAVSASSGLFEIQLNKLLNLTVNDVLEVLILSNPATLPGLSLFGANSWFEGYKIK